MSQLPDDTQLMDAATLADVGSKAMTRRLDRLAKIIRYKVDAAMCAVAPQLAGRKATYADVKAGGWNMLFDRCAHASAVQAATQCVAHASYGLTHTVVSTTGCTVLPCLSLRCAHQL